MLSPLFPVFQCNPPLEISGVPDKAKSLVLIMDDLDAQLVAGHT
ncbi:hypothetical protein EA473_21745 [Natrarchaeobius chitinivorans]|uniref:Uncharacterized protein n=1 Tax=Natrarchaeobius chitinivorans TaxID=1679083 RepID=A0A3N6LNP4_NATCH|nr:hypothetical protein EA473_21745 [Natrarchaeobius chitinivorans]